MSVSCRLREEESAYIGDVELEVSSNNIDNKRGENESPIDRRGTLKREEQVGTHVSKRANGHDNRVVHPMEDARHDDIPDDSRNDLGQQLDSDVQGLHVTHFLHVEGEPEVGGEEGHHAENSSEDELGIVRRGALGLWMREDLRE